MERSRATLEKFYARYQVSRRFLEEYNKAKKRGSCKAGLCTSILAGLQEDAKEKEALLIATSPQDYDSRNAAHTGGIKVLPPVKKQGLCSSCVGFSVASAASAAMASVLKTNATNPQMHVSARDLYFCPRDERRCDSGWTFTDALANLTTRGHRLLDESCLPSDGFDEEAIQELPYDGKQQVGGCGVTLAACVLLWWVLQGIFFIEVRTMHPSMLIYLF